MNLDQLKATIEAEALRRQAARDGFTLDSVKEYLGGGLTPPPLRSMPPPPPQPLTFGYLAGLSGRGFIDACYVNILGREADQAGLAHHLMLLSRGEDKAFVVGAIRYSAEGRARNVPVPGLFPRFAAAAAQRVPIAGNFVGWLVALLTVNSRMRHARAFEEHVRSQLEAVADHIDRSSAVVAMRVEALRTVLEPRDQA